MLLLMLLIGGRRENEGMKEGVKKGYGGEER